MAFVRGQTTAPEAAAADLVGSPASRRGPAKPRLWALKGLVLRREHLWIRALLRYIDELFPALPIARGALRLSQGSLGANLVWKRCC